MVPPVVKRYLIALNRHKWAGLAGFAVVLGLSGIAAIQPAPPENYVAQGVLTYSSPPIIVSETGAALQQQVQTLTSEMLLTDEVINRVTQQLQQQQIDIDSKTLRRDATVNINRDDDDSSSTLFIEVKYQDADPELAELAANLLIEAIVERSRQFNQQQISRILTNLNQLLPKVEEDLREAEQNLERYIRDEGPDIQVAQDGDLLQAITGAQQQQRQIRLTLSGIDAQIRSLQSRLGLSPDEAYASSALSADPIIADLRAQIYQNETQIAILSQSLRPDHPTMIELRAQQAAFDKLVQQRVGEVIGGTTSAAAPINAPDSVRQASSLDPARQELANQLVNLQTQRETLQQQLQAYIAAEQEFREDYTALPNKQLERSRLEQQVQLKRGFYDQLQARLTDVTIAENEAVGSLVVVQPVDSQLAVEAGRNPLVILIVGSIVGVLVGGGLVLLLDSLDATFHTLPDLQNALRQQEVPVLGLLPQLPKDANGLSLILDPDSAFNEPYERLRSNLRHTNGSKPLRVIILTSTVSGEGKTLTAYNLAIASARAGKRTLLIEADLRSPSQAAQLRVTPDPNSLLEPFHYYGQVSSSIRLVPEVENLFILPSPGPQRQAAAILESSEMRRMLEDVRGRFDQVILDTPCLSRYSDAILLEPLTDGLLLITRPGHTENGLLNEAIDQFIESEDIQFLGAAINGADMPVQPDYSKSLDTRYWLDDADQETRSSRISLL